MKYIIFIFTNIVTIFCLKAQDYKNQRYDRERIILDLLTLGCSNIDANDQFIKVGSLMDFNNDSLELSAVDTFFSWETELKYYQFSNSAQICNKEGKFTAFYNGVYLFDRYGNREELTMFKESPDEYPQFKWFNRSVILPYIGKDSTYLLLTPSDHVNDPNYDVITATSISGLSFRELPDGKLKILEFIPDIIHGKFCPMGTMSAVRHANGRDWWIIAPERLKKNVHTFLFTPNGFFNKGEQSTKDTTADFTFAPGFSPDGQWYTRTDVRSITQNSKIGTIQFYKFNRCNGLFEDQITFDLDFEDTASVVQVIFEKNSRYFYVMNYLTIYQGDIQATDIKGSLVKIAKSLPLEQFGTHMCFGAGFLGPDDKIHIFDGRPLFYGSTINNPSERGAACNFEYENVIYPACTSISFGNMPNFNLGPLDGSPCDTLGLDNPLAVDKETKKHIEYNIYPNPSNSLIHTDYNFERKDLKMKILDYRGKVILNGHAISLKTGIDISDIAPGVYFVIIEGMPVKKMIKI